MEQFKWSQKLISRLILLFKKHENLYNYYREDYIDKNKRAASMLQIFMELKKLNPTITNDALRKKLYTLRTQYTKEKNLMNLAKKNGKVYDPKLWWFKDMNFLNRFCKSRKEDVFNLQKKSQNLNILQQLKMDIHERVLNKSERKFEWLGQSLASAVSKVRNEEFQDAVVWEIQKVLHEAHTKDRLLRQENTNLAKIVVDSDV